MGFGFMGTMLTTSNHPVQGVGHLISEDEQWPLDSEIFSLLLDLGKIRVLMSSTRSASNGDMMDIRGKKVVSTDINGDTETNPKPKTNLGHSH